MILAQNCSCCLCVLTRIFAVLETYTRLLTKASNMTVVEVSTAYRGFHFI